MTISVIIIFLMAITAGHGVCGINGKAHMSGLTSACDECTDNYSNNPVASPTLSPGAGPTTTTTNGGDGEWGDRRNWPPVSSGDGDGGYDMNDDGADVLGAIAGPFFLVAAILLFMALMYSFLFLCILRLGEYRDEFDGRIYLCGTRCYIPLCWFMWLYVLGGDAGSGGGDGARHYISREEREAAIYELLVAMSHVIDGEEVKRLCERLEAIEGCHENIAIVAGGTGAQEELTHQNELPSQSDQEEEKKEEIGDHCEQLPVAGETKETIRNSINAQDPAAGTESNGINEETFSLQDEEAQNDDGKGRSVPHIVNQLEEDSCKPNGQATVNEENTTERPAETGDVDPPDEPTCSICLDEYEEGDICVTSKGCPHRFHRDCVMDWLTRRNKTACPYCRQDMITNDEVWEIVQRIRRDRRNNRRRKHKDRVCGRCLWLCGNITELSSHGFRDDNDEDEVVEFQNFSSGRSSIRIGHSGDAEGDNGVLDYGRRNDLGTLTTSPVHEQPIDIETGTGGDPSRD